jgi:hypothetical protein
LHWLLHCLYTHLQRCSPQIAAAFPTRVFLLSPPMDWTG